ncbi:MAG: alcohol dehydrogenase catalytic domain-containing protein [Rhodobacteraceae bacterium]|nr:alcohol dehydrogenase catalytic domain-containing protein [Paracoccaceae bacterium]
MLRMTDRATMKAVTFQGYGPPETLAIRDVPLPMPGVGEVRVQVHASTVTRTDTATMRGHPFFARAATGFCRPKMPTPGIDFAGIIDALGAGVTGFAPGDASLACRPTAMAPMPNICVCAPMRPSRPCPPACASTRPWWARAPGTPMGPPVSSTRVNAV